MKFEQIFQNNREWIEEKLKTDRDYFKNLSKGQNPDILYIGCSDSRVTAEELMGMKPGEVFVHRNIANMVPNTDLSAMSVINYALII
jgi:carbonic anhydrase